MKMNEVKVYSPLSYQSGLVKIPVFSYKAKKRREKGDKYYDFYLVGEIGWLRWFEGLNKYFNPETIHEGSHEGSRIKESILLKSRWNNNNGYSEFFYPLLAIAEGDQVDLPSEIFVYDLFFSSFEHDVVITDEDYWGGVESVAQEEGISNGIKWINRRINILAFQDVFEKVEKEVGRIFALLIEARVDLPVPYWRIGG